MSPQKSDSFLVFVIGISLAFEIIENNFNAESDQRQRPEPGDLPICQQIKVSHLKNNADRQHHDRGEQGKIFPAAGSGSSAQHILIDPAGFVVTVDDLKNVKPSEHQAKNNTVGFMGIFGQNDQNRKKQHVGDTFKKIPVINRSNSGKDR